jgi:hypothetical protein
VHRNVVSLILWPCGLTIKGAICTIAMFLEAHVFSPYLSVYKTKVQWNTIGT